MLYEATHVTRHMYEEPVSQCLNELRVTPRSFPGQTVRESNVGVQPTPAAIQQRTDYFGNEVTSFAIFEMHDRFTATATSIVEIEPAPARQVLPIAWEEVRDLLAAAPDAECLQASEFIFDSPYVATGPELADFARPVFTPGRPLQEALEELSHRVHTEFRYLPKSTSIDMPLVEVLRQRRGVCQDFAHVMIGSLRSLRLAARYVSGYLRSGSKYLGAQASHAWVSAFIPGAGWMQFDPTNDTTPSDGHLTLGWGRDYGDVTPVKGITLGGGEQTVEVEVRVKALEIQ